MITDSSAVAVNVVGASGGPNVKLKDSFELALVPDGLIVETR